MCFISHKREKYLPQGRVAHIPHTQNGRFCRIEQNQGNTGNDAKQHKERISTHSAQHGNEKTNHLPYKKWNQSKLSGQQISALQALFLHPEYQPKIDPLKHNNNWTHLGGSIKEKWILLHHKL